METPEQIKIKNLEAEVYTLTNSLEELELINTKLGYSTKIMSEFHLTQEDKQNIANSIDLATSAAEVESVYSEYKKAFHNNHLSEEFEEFQMSPDFKENILSYLTIANGEDSIEKISEDIKIVTEYFSLENKIRSTPEANHRQALTDKLLQQRTGTIEALNRIIDTLNRLNGSTEA